MATSSAPLAKLTEVAAPSSPKVEVDELDLALLRFCLEGNCEDEQGSGQCSNQGSKLHVSLRQCAR